MTAPAAPGPIRGMLDATLDRFRSIPPVQRQPLRGPRAFLQSEHEIHAQWSTHWKWLEQTMKGGEHVKALLRRFDWEQDDGDSITQRRRTATYPNWPYLFAATLAGFLTRSAPVPTYGGLGEITSPDTPLGQQTRADLFHFNVDGQGGQGSEWAAWWDERVISAATYGFTWLHEEAPGAATISARTGNQAQERAGIRPYAVEWTPLSVWDWHFGPTRQLEYLIIRYRERVVRQEGDTFTAGHSQRFYLHTRRGWTNFGPEYAGGGFWLYDDKGEIVQRNGVEVKGNYDSMNGEIPIHPLFALRDRGTEERPAIARSMIEELAAMAEGYMNLASARDFEVWDAAKGMEYFIGMDKDAFNLAMEKIAEGSRFIPVAATILHPSPSVVPSSMGTVSADVFDGAQRVKKEDATAASGISQNAGPDASGISREADFASAKAPALARFAAEVQSAQNTMIYNIQRRWGIAEATIGGGVVWPRKFELVRFQEAIQQIFDAAVSVGATSPTLFSQGLVKLGQENGTIANDKDGTKIAGEIIEGFKTSAAAAAATASLRSIPAPTGKTVNVNVRRPGAKPKLPSTPASGV